MLQLIHSVVAHVGDLGTALLRQPLVAYTLLPIVTDVQLRLDTIFEGQPAHTIVGITFVFSLLFVAAWRFLFASDEPWMARAKRGFFSCVKKLPYVSGLIEKELDKARSDMKASLFKSVEGEEFNLELPEHGLSKGELMDRVNFLAYEMGGEDWEDGRVSGTVYHGGQALSNILGDVYCQFMWTNPLHADVFPGVRKMEAEVVQMVVNMFHGDDQACGAMTAGGTESIAMACLAYRNWARETKGITQPNMVVPVSAHAAFDKAGGYFGIRVVHVPVDPKTRCADVKAMRKAINSNTILICGSAPGYPHGVIDPLVELGQLALDYDIGMHMDCCLGGFLVPFMDKAGFSIGKFGFAVPGVTSISCDTHKYGFSPKGSSVVMYNTPELRKHMFFVQPDWPGGIYATATLPGSRTGGIVAATWAALMYMGEDGYVKTTKKIVTTTRKIEAGIRAIPGLFTFGSADVCVTAFGSNDFNILMLANRMKEQGWNLNSLQFPVSVHVCVTMPWTKRGVVNRFLEDLREGAEFLMKNKDIKATGMAAMYGMAQSIPDRSLISGIVSGYFDAYYNAKPNHAVSPDEAGSSSTAGGDKVSRSHVSADTSDDMIYDSE